MSGTEGPAVEHRGARKEAQEWGKASEQGCPGTGSGGAVSLEAGEFAEQPWGGGGGVRVPRTTRMRNHVEET